MDSPIYQFDKEKKKVVDPLGNPLTITQLLGHLNEMYHALNELHLAWRMGSDMIMVMDNVFLGASSPTEEDVPLVEEETPSEGVESESIEPPTLTVVKDVEGDEE